LHAINCKGEPKGSHMASILEGVGGGQRVASIRKCPTIPEKLVMGQSM